MQIIVETLEKTLLLIQSQKKRIVRRINICYKLIEKTEQNKSLIIRKGELYSKLFWLDAIESKIKRDIESYKSLIENFDIIKF